MSCRRCFLVALASLSLMSIPVLSGCSDSSRRELFAQGRPIVHGSPDNDPAHMATVALTNGPGTDFFCSGTLITNNVVLTAAHCLEDYWGNPVNPTSIDVFFGDDVHSGGDYRAVAEGEQNPSWNRSSLYGDAALLRLSSTAPSDVAPIPYLPTNLELTEADEGTTIVDFSGFGLDEHGSSGEKLHVEDYIDIVCDTAGGCSNGQVVQNSFSYDEDPGGPCSGDSGGPAYVMRSNVEYVAGVTSYGDQNCSYFGVSTNISRYASWIDDFIGGSVSEDCTNEEDDDGDDLIDCDDPDCASHPNCLGPSACAEAEDIDCGDQINGTTVGGAMNFSSYSCLQGSEDGPEVAYRVTASIGAAVTATMQPGSNGDLDLFLLNGSSSDCDPDDCIDGSVESDDSPEQITFNMGSQPVYLVVETYDNPTTFQLSLSCGEAEICDNDQDDDGDQLVDCDDPDCASHPDCAGTTACNLAETLSCGDKAADNTSNGVDVFSTYSCLTGYSWNGPEVAYFIDAPAGTDVVATMTHGGASADLDMFLLPASGNDCNPQACIDGSYEPEPPEQISFTQPSGGTFLVVDSWQGTSSFSVSISCSSVGENCTNDTDDDGDDLVDCDDPDCSNHPACEPDEEICDNEIDDDGDDLTDCDDPQCDGHPACEAQENCENEVDDDGDDLVDCDDPDCAEYPTCLPEGNCQNDIDDDKDGLTDCEDDDCDDFPLCQPQENCTNEVDDDGDDLVDCDDPDCSEHAACQTQDEDCTNEVDDDGDDLVDCDDPDCSEHAACQTPDEDCTNEVDDDGDDLTDCDDPDCSDYPACESTDSGGCSCSASGSASRGPALFVLLGLLLVLRRRGFRRGSL